MAFALGACGNDSEDAPTPASDVVETPETQEPDASNTDADTAVDVTVDVKKDSTETDAAE
jgi:hypothetical protein